MGGKELIWGSESSLNLDGILEADRLGKVLALLFRHVNRDVGALLGGNRLALCLPNLKISDFKTALMNI